MMAVSRSELLGELQRLLHPEPGVVAAAISGSVAHDNSDSWSDVDVSVYVEPTRLQSLWSSRRLLLSRFRPLSFLADIDHIVPYSTMGFYQDGTRIHITYKVIDLFSSGAADEVILFSPEGSDHPLADRAVEIEHEYTPQVFTFWLHRAWVGVHRADELQQVESFIRLLEIYLSRIARARIKQFYGLRKVDRYLTHDEIAWVQDCLHLLTRHRVLDAIVDVTERYLAEPGPSARSSDEVAAEDYARELALGLRHRDPRN